jgi:hypothetical protein
MRAGGVYTGFFLSRIRSQSLRATLSPGPILIFCVQYNETTIALLNRLPARLKSAGILIRAQSRNTEVLKNWNYSTFRYTVIFALRQHCLPDMVLLPSELYMGIFQFVPKSDLKSIRLVSKRLHTISSPFLINKVYASFHFQDLKVLEAISNHPTLRLLVKEVVYLAVYFYLSEIRNHERGKFSKSDFLLGRRYYLDCLVKSDKMWHERDDLNIIFAAIARMPNINCLPSQITGVLPEIFWASVLGPNGLGDS